MEMTEKQSEIALIFASISDQKDKYPTRAEMMEAGVSRDRIRDHFGNMDKMKKDKEERLKKMEKHNANQN